MTPSRLAATATVLSLATVVAVIGGAVALGAAPVAAHDHTKEEAQDFTEEANFTVNFPFTSDHYPGDANEANGSIQYFATGEDAFQEVTDEDGVYLDYVIIDADWIDYSECSTDNTFVFGIDRGNDNPGTQIDQDAVSRQKSADFRDDGLTIDFYTFEDFANDPPYMEENDAVVAEQGERSSAGGCLTVTDEPGWYQLQGFINGTEADNGQGEEPSDDAARAGINAHSNYLYVCDCDSRAEAEEQLGPAPDDSGGDPTPTPTETEDGETVTVTPESGEDTPTPAAEPTATPADESEDGDGGDADEDDADEQQADTDTPSGTAESDAGGDAGGGGDQPLDENATPTPGDAPGFTGLAALVALLAGALLVRRRH